MAKAKKILIIDDEMTLLTTLDAYFGKEGYKVATALDGKEGLKMVKIFKPNIILLDIIMPKIDGISLLKKLRKDPKTKKIPVIILTNLKTKESVAEAMKAGITDYLVKVDYTLDELSKKVSKALRAAKQ